MGNMKCKRVSYVEKYNYRIWLEKIEIKTLPLIYNCSRGKNTVEPPHLENMKARFVHI